MKKLFVVMGFAAAVCLTGCDALYKKVGTSPKELHDLAVEKVTAYAEDAINEKIDKSEKLSEAEKAKLKEEVAKLKAEIIAKIAEIKEKAENPKSETPSATTDTKAATETDPGGKAADQVK